MSAQPAFAFGPGSPDAIAAALVRFARWSGNKSLRDAAECFLESCVKSAQPAHRMYLVGWLLKWEARQEVRLIEVDEDPRTEAWGDNAPSEIINVYAHLTLPPKPLRPIVPGQVTLRTDWEGIGKGSTLTNLRDLGDKWLCEWPTPVGTVSNLEVPKSLCTERKESQS